MTNYAMIPINRRIGFDGERIVRRVLISYLTKVDGVYKNSKIIEKDDYFKNPNASQQYEFYDDGFKLISNGYSRTILDGIQNSLLEKLRPYEFDAGLLFETAIEFREENDELAIYKFQNREVL